MSPLYLVVEADPFIAEDLIDIVRDFSSDASVLHYDALTDALVERLSVLRVRGAFLGPVAQGPRSGDLVRILTERSADVVWIGACRDPLQGTAALAVPLSSDAVVTLLNTWDLVRR